MTSTPNGRWLPTGTGGDIVISRTFKAPVEDVWASVTESDRTARWFGPWKGDPAPGRTIQVQMAFEEQTPWSDVRIEACEPPRRLAVSMGDEAGDWEMELLLAERDGVTTLQLVHHRNTAEGIGEIGPGWEFYLDMLVAARDDTARPAFDDYYPSMQAYYEGLIRS